MNNLIEKYKISNHKKDEILLTYFFNYKNNIIDIVKIYYLLNPLLLVNINVYRFMLQKTINDQENKEITDSETEPLDNIEVDEINYNLILEQIDRIRLINIIFMKILSLNNKIYRFFYKDIINLNYDNIVNTIKTRIFMILKSYQNDLSLMQLNRKSRVIYTIEIKSRLLNLISFFGRDIIDMANVRCLNNTEYDKMLLIDQHKYYQDVIKKIKYFFTNMIININKIGKINSLIHTFSNTNINQDIITDLIYELDNLEPIYRI